MNKLMGILNIYETLGIKEVSTRQQRLNGTMAFAIHHNSTTLNEHFAIYSSGYVRRTTNRVIYPINKRKIIGEGRRMRLKIILIYSKEDRLQFLLNYLLKNYIQKPAEVIKTVYKFDKGITIENRMEHRCLFKALIDLKAHSNNLILANRNSGKDSPNNLFINEINLVEDTNNVNKLIERLNKVGRYN